MKDIRLSEFIINRLHQKYKVKYISLITGNGALVLNDALAKNKNIKPICVHHEQDAGYFCLGYSKYTNKISVCNPTTGCASFNVLTPLLSAFQDHAPILFLSGNVALKQTTRYFKLKEKINLKKLGAQEADIIEMVKPITKYAVTIDDPERVEHELDKAIDIALTAPFGPVWIDIPADIGAAFIKKSNLIKYQKKKILKKNNSQILQFKNLLNKFKRPIVIGGNGIKLSNTENKFKKFIQKYKLPCVFTYGGADILEYDHPLKIGIIGVKGDRAGNFALQNSDGIICLGCCLNTPQVGYISEKFAKNAKKIVVDIDAENHRKNTIKIDLFINSDLNNFFKYTNE
jgi:acetolactate synthase-1/2/3 large subunit